MDVLFDGLDQLMEAARRRFPVTVTVVGLVLWGLLALGSGFLLAREQHPVVAALVLAGPVILLVWSGLRGIGRIPSPIWPLGVSVLVIIGGLFVPQIYAPSPLSQLAVTVVSFVYVQVFLAVLVAVDALRRNRALRRNAPGDPPGIARRAQRRVLQLKLLLATLLVAALTHLGDPRDYYERAADPDGGPPLLLKTLFVLVLALAFAGVFLRRRGLAATVAAGLLAAFAIDLYVLAPHYRITLLVQQGWLVLTTTYLWAKAAAKPYWQWPDPRQPPEPPEPPDWTPLPEWDQWPTRW